LFYPAAFEAAAITLAF